MRKATAPPQFGLLEFAPLLVIASVFLSCTSDAAASAQFVLVSKHKPKAEIVVQANQPGEPLAFAARELKRYVKEISQADLAVVHTQSKKPAIILTVRPLQQDEKASQDPREEDHYRLSVDGKKLEIAGASPRAVLFGVYDVLERLGCGWCVPGEDSIPRTNTLKLPPLQVDTRPAFQYRMMLDFEMRSVAQTLAIVDWLSKNRMNWMRECANAHGEPKAWYDRRDRVVPELKNRGLRLIVGGHTMHTWLPETNFPAHKEWFAYEKGERKPPTLCVANQEMTGELIKNMQHFLNRCPEVDVIDLWHTDGEAFCHCHQCTRGLLPESTKGEKPESMPVDVLQASYVISYVEFANRVAEAIARSHPNVLVSPLVYSQADRAMPDGAMLTNNILIGLAHFFRDSFRPLIGEPKSSINLRFLGNDLTWIAKSKHHYIYEYYNCWVAPYIYPGAQIIVQDLRTLQDLQVQGVSSDMYGYSPVNMYVAARALWSPDISWENAIRDFCYRYFGDVGQEMAENELRLERGIYGLSGYQASGARDPEKWKDPPGAGLYLGQQRQEQIAFLNRLISQTKDARVKVRLERQLKPWVSWDKEQRYWAFPEFKDTE